MCDFEKRNGNKCGKPTENTKKQCLIHYNILNPSFKQDSPLKNPATKKRALYTDDNAETECRIYKMNSLMEQMEKLCSLDEKLKSKKESVDVKLEKKAKSLFYYHMKKNENFMKEINTEYNNQHNVSDDSIVHYKYVHNKTDKLYNDMCIDEKNIWISKVKDGLL